MAGIINPTPQIDALTAKGASTAIEVPYGVLEHSFEVWFTENALNANKVSALTINVQGSLRDDGSNGVLNKEGPILAIGSTPEQIANSAFSYRIANTNYTKAAVAAGSAFTSAHVVTASKLAAINVYIDVSGNILTLSAQLGQDQTVAIGSDTIAAAITIAEGIPLPLGYCYIGRVLISADSGGWTAITDDMTDGSDLTSATFVSESPGYEDIVTHVFTAEDITKKRSMFTLSNTWFKYMRFYIYAITGTGKVYAQHFPIKFKVKG